jgi:NADH dehydrogenase/NADH:ubiquinone oxidoreductase subunit G
LTKTETIDVMDALGLAIRVDARGDAVLRMLPRVNEDVNEEWISDKTRYAEDGLKRQRLDRPYIRENGKLRAASWDEALARPPYALKRDGSKIGAIAGDLACAESMKATLDLFRALGSPNTIAAPMARSSAAARVRLSLQLDHRRHRRSGRDPARRRQPAHRSAGAERAHAQALAARRGDRVSARRLISPTSTRTSAPARNRSGSRRVSATS